MSRRDRLGPLDQVSLFYRDVERSTRFYGEVLGLPHLGTFGDLVFFDVQGVRLYLRRKDDAAWCPGSVLYFDAEDIRGQAATLASAGVSPSAAPHLVHRREGKPASRPGWRSSRTPTGTCSRSRPA